MAGEISNLYGDSLYNYNPYSANNDDFLAQQYFAQNPQNPQNTQNPIFTGAYQQPQADTFQKSGGSGLATGLALGTIAGLGTGAGTYFWGTNPIKDGKVSDDLIKAVNKINTESAAIENFSELYEAKAQPIFDTIGIKNMEQYNAVQKLAKAGKLEDLSDDVKKLLPDSIKSPKDAQAAINLAAPEFEKIDKEKLMKQAVNKAKNELSLEYNNARLENLKNIETKIKTLKKDATKADLEKFFVDNAETFKLKGTNTEIAQKAKKMADKIGTPEQLQKIYEGHIKRRTSNIEALKSSAAENFKANYDESAKALKKEAPEGLKEAFKKFKWNKTLKFGGIAAGAGLVLGWLFGGSGK